jgi:hypothetical protein
MTPELGVIIRAYSAFCKPPPASLIREGLDHAKGRYFVLVSIKSAKELLFSLALLRAKAGPSGMRLAPRKLLTLVNSLKL